MAIWRQLSQNVAPHSSRKSPRPLRNPLKRFISQFGKRARTVELQSSVPSRKLWAALHALDGYLTGQSDWLVNYAARHRAGLRVGTAITEGTANFLVNRRMNCTNRSRCAGRGAAPISCSSFAAPSTTARSAPASDRNSIQLTILPIPSPMPLDPQSCSSPLSRPSLGHLWSETEVTAQANPGRVWQAASRCYMPCRG